jgi:hypothetical protein
VRSRINLICRHVNVIQLFAVTQYIPGFRGNGWILIRSPLLSADKTKHSPVSYLNIRFSTKSQNSLLVWIQQVGVFYYYPNKIQKIPKITFLPHFKISYCIFNKIGVDTFAMVYYYVRRKLKTKPLSDWVYLMEGCGLFGEATATPPTQPSSLD